MAIPANERRDALETLSDNELIRLLLRANPFGGYSIGERKGQQTRQEAINVLLRFEGYRD